MNFDKILSYSFASGKDAIAGMWVQEGLLVVARILVFLLLLGSMLKVCRGEKTTPEVTTRGTLFIDGIR